MKNFNMMDKFKYKSMKHNSNEKFIAQLNKISNLNDIEKKLHKAIQNFEEATNQLEFKFEELKDFGQMIQFKGKMIFFIAPDKHELIYQWMNFTSTVSKDFCKAIKDTVSTLLSLKYKDN